MNNSEKAIQILRLTNDGDKLSPPQLSLTQYAINDFLSEIGQEEFDRLHQKVLSDNYKEWFHDIEHLDRKHDGCVYWKGIFVDQYFIQDYEREKAAAQELASRCRHLESVGVEISITTAVWSWDKYKPE